MDPRSHPQDKWSRSHELKLYIDASGSIGYAAVFGGQWFYGKWDTYWQYKTDAILEFYTIVVAIKNVDLQMCFI